MTSETKQTKQTGQAAADTATGPRLRALITRARVVLFDFDGPICRLFAGHRADDVAGRLIDWVESRGLRDLLSEGERGLADPQAVLRAVHRGRPGSDLVAELEERLTQEELRAAASAWPTPYADPLIRTWTAVGARLAIATNNAPLGVRSYLDSRGLTECFAPHVYGRTREVHLLKPHPHCLARALNALGAAPEDALMIGDTPSDLAAARDMGVPFLGYARNENKERQLREHGGEHLVSSLLPVLEAVRARG